MKFKGTFLITMVIIVFFSAFAWGEILGEKLIPIEIVEAKSSSVESESFGPQLAIDRNFYSRWGSEHGESSQWLSLDLGVAEEIDTIVINWEFAAARKYKIQTSLDGYTWRDVAEINEGNGSVEVINIKTTKARYVRIYCMVRISEYGYSIHEVGIFKNW